VLLRQGDKYSKFSQRAAKLNVDRLSKTKERQDDPYNDDQPDQIDEAIHAVLLRTLRHFN
jgi:hypothetical protein